MRWFGVLGVSLWCLGIMVGCSQGSPQGEQSVESQQEAKPGEGSDKEQIAQEEPTTVQEPAADASSGVEPVVDGGPVDTQPGDLGTSPEGAGEPSVDAAPQEAPPEPPPAEGPGRQDQVLTGGDVQGRWCGNITVKGNITIPAGKTLEVCAGTEVTVSTSVSVTVQGSLLLRGAEKARILWKGDSGEWRGLRVEGSLAGSYVDLRDATFAIDGRSGSSIKLSYLKIEKSRNTLRLANGGDFSKTTILGGASIRLTGGLLKMVDTLVDLQHPRQSPDCTSINGGGMELDHVRMTGCHCPLHIEVTTMPVKITNSIFDQAAYSVMIAKSKATFTNNHFESQSVHILDIGGGSQVDVANNYWEGGAPNIQTTDRSQFTGDKQYSARPFANVGPR